MRVVLDTNVLVSGLMAPTGPCGRVVELMFAGALTPCVDARMVEEYRAVLPRPLFQFCPEDVTGTLEFIRSRAERIAPMPLSVNLPHEDDRPFLEVAASAAAVLITGNKRHYPKKARGQVIVVGCSELLDLLRDADGETGVLRV